MVKIAFFDIDGTLITFNDMIMPDSTKYALNELHKKGIKVFISTGRSHKDTLFIKQYFDFDGIVCSNGQYCIDNNNREIHKSVIPKESIKKMCDYVKLTNERLEFVNNEARFMLNNSIEQNVDIIYLTEKELTETEIMQVNIFNEPQYDKIFKEYCPDCQITRWVDSFADVYPANGGKHIGIQKVLDYYGFAKDDAIAFGDGGNDISMLRYLPNSVAMGNAKDDVKNSAKFVTKDILVDGIYYALKTLNII